MGGEQSCCKLHPICSTGVHRAHHTKCSWRPQVEPICGGGIVCCAWFPICNHTLCPELDDDGADSRIRWRARASQRHPESRNCDSANDYYARSWAMGCLVRWRE